MARSVLTCDVLVAGGGPSGTVAAAAAARAGCRVLLVEASNRLGGIAVQAPLHRICGLYPSGTDAVPALLNEGLVQEVVTGLNRVRPSVSTPAPLGKLHVLPFRAADFEKILADMVRAERTLTLLSNTRPKSLSVHKGRVEEVILSRNEQSITVAPEVVIDATGNASLVSLAGSGVLSADPEDRQMGGYVVRLGGCDADDMTGVRVAYVMHEAVEEGIVPRCFRFTAWEPLEDSSDKGFLKFSVPASIAGPEAFALENSERAIAFLKERITAFRTARVEYASRRVFARQAQSIEGEYRLTEEDVVSGRRFEDGLVKNSWPVEFWHPEKGPVYKYVAPGDYYEIPLRCLRPVGMANLLAVGTCLCADPKAHASARVIGPCIALGDKAGEAAAEFAAHGQWKPGKPEHG